MSNPELIPAITQPALTGLHLLRLRWYILALFGLVGTAAAIAFYLWLPKTYEAELLIVPQRGPSEFGSVRNLVGNLPLDLNASSGLGQSEPDRIAAVLQSRSVTDAIIAKFDLKQRYGTTRLERARKALWAHCETSVDKKANTVSLTCEDKEPEAARDIANAIGREADATFRRIAVSSATEERSFLEKRVAEAKHDMEVSSAALRRFQETHKIIDLPEQGKAVVSGMAALEGELITKRLELSYARGFAASEEASVAQLRRQIGVLSAELQSLEAKRPVEPNQGRAPRPGSEMFPPAMELPALGAELETLLRDHKIDETVFLMLTERYEARKLDEARDLSTFVVVDEAVLPTYRVRPTLRVIPVGMLVGLTLGLLIIALPAWWSDLRRRAALEGQAGAA